MIGALLERFAAAEHHVAVVRMPSACANVHIDPVLRGTFQATDAVAHGVVENSAPPPGMESARSRKRAMVSGCESADLGMLVISGAEKQCSGFEALFDGAQQVFVPVNFESGAGRLHQDASAAQVDGLLNFVEDIL